MNDQEKLLLEKCKETTNRNYYNFGMDIVNLSDKKREIPDNEYILSKIKNLDELCYRIKNRQEKAQQLSIAYQKYLLPYITICFPSVISSWKPNDIISYIAERYEKHYGIEYTFRMNHKLPSKSYEAWQIGKLTQMLSKDPVILKNYIDWIFSEKIIERKKQIRTLAIFTEVANINEFKWQVMNKTPDRTTPLPQNILDITSAFDPTILNYGDLAFVSKSEDESCKSMIRKVAESGFDLGKLEKIK